MADKFINATELMTELAMLYKHADWSPRECHFSLFDMQMNIDGMKPADVVPVVRCKDCKHYNPEARCVGGTYHGCKVLDGPDGCEMEVDEFFFCAYGERRDPDA